MAKRGVSAAGAGGHICVNTPARAGPQKLFRRRGKDRPLMCTAWEVPPARSDELCNSTKARWGLAPNDRDQIAFEDGTRRARARVPKAGRAALEKIGRGYRAGGGPSKGSSNKNLGMLSLIHI